eukprot:TRINITY_DN112337_c0_g1_i1.p1 TRINITY_DN112337_c0_g1~~TRINITY_DN112337_c0_g1_i1.p1  ORF type:complete len:281 (-),score=77.15 TRINITY_DN112337_c0_g1_i1:95-937(-)
MAPVKFGDIAKPAADVLGNDYQTSGYQFKAKQKTSWNSAVATTAVELWPEGSKVVTPGKITFKIPKPYGIAGLSVDKLEVDKSGGVNVETSASCCLHNVQNLNVELKNNFKTMNTLAPNATFTYTGLADTRVQLDAPVFSPENLKVEASALVPHGTVGVKFALDTLTKPDLGARFQLGDAFGSLTVTQKLKCFSAHCCYKVSNELKAAMTASKDDKGIKGAAGVEYVVNPTTTVKAKVDQDQNLHASVKYDVQKGFTVVAGGKFAFAAGKHSYGVSLSVE